MSEPIRRRGKVNFPQVLQYATLVSHATLVVPFAEVFRRAEAPYPWLLGAGAAALLALPIRGRIQAIIQDTPRAGWQVVALDEPYFAHWCATFFGAPFQAAALLVKLAYDLIAGHPPAPPGVFALCFYLFMLAMGVYSVKIRRRWVRLLKYDVNIEGLDPAFDGFRIAQLSDLHIGGALPPGLAERWVSMANGEAPDLTVVTGDLVTSGVNFHDRIASLLGGLKAPEGVVVSMGNHDYFGEGDPLVTKLRGAGVEVLRNESRLIERGGAALRLSAVDDTWTSRADLEKTLAGPKPAPTVLLAHDPNLFDRAAELGADLVLSGHTHGGQLAMPFAVERFNLARIAYRYTYGFYRRERSTLYVHAGMGTTGPPARLGAAPELVIFTLRRAPG